MGSKVPNTISDKAWKSLQNRAHKQRAATGGMFTAKAVAQRKAASAQLKNAKKN